MASSVAHEDGDLTDVSDQESLYADSPIAESPSDGYFERRDHPQETFVEQSAVRAETEAKAREATQSTMSQRVSEIISPRQSLYSPVQADESTPLLDAGPAPPDYAAATAGRSRDGPMANSPPSRDRDEHSSPPTSSGYGNIAYPAYSDNGTAQEGGAQWPFGPRGSPFGSQFPFGPEGSPFTPGFPFGTVQAPQSMRGGPSQMPEHMSSPGSARREQSRYRRQRWRRAYSCGRSTILAVVLVGLAILAVIAIGARLARQAARHNIPASGGGGDGRNSSDGIGSPDTTEPFQPAPAHPPSDVCAVRYTTEALFFDFANPDSFTLLEAMDSVLYMTGGVSGTTYISAAPPDQEAAIRVWVSYGMSEDGWEATDMDHTKAEDGLELSFPQSNGQRHRGKWARNPCMTVSINIYIKGHVNLDTLAVLTKNLDIEAGQGPPGLPDYDLVSGTWVIDKARFTTTAGSVYMPYWSTRETRIETHSGEVKGEYALQDLLSIKTWSGRIGIRVSGLEEGPGTPKPAVLDVFSRSASVRVDFPTVGEQPWRDYQTSIETHSGSINGNYFFTSKFEVSSWSGSINADLQPFPTRLTPYLSSNVNSASTNLKILPYLNDTSAIISNLKSNHKSRSGSLDLQYPKVWEGMIEGTTSSGSINIRGDGVEYYYQGDRKVVAHKGYGKSKLEFTGQSSSVNIRIGD
ncbi:hypothetical protein LTR86_007979 [Recurvomyces mirabilis]|nr:hypothetical protein LTR86_007979 [Recurvomyces mirabilis]